MAVASPSVPLLVVGLSHRTAAAEVRETLAFRADEAADLLVRGRREEAWTEAMLLATCNRTELYAVPGPGAERAGGLAARLAAAKSVEGASTEGCLYRAEGEGAVRHLVRVACGLDSMVLGESEIAGQLREAHRLAREAGTAGRVLDRVVPEALRISARARDETGIHRGVTSVPAAALALAKRHAGDLSRARVLVVGAGEAGRIGARLFASEGTLSLRIVDRTASRALALAAETRASAVSWDRLEWALEEADVVLTAVGAPDPILTCAGLGAAALRRPGRRLVILDIGIPRNVEPGARDVDGVLLFDSDDIARLIDQNREHRRTEVEKVDAMVEEGLERILRVGRRTRSEPLVSEIRRSLEDLRQRELERSQRHFSHEQYEHLDRLTRSLLDKAYHVPMKVLGETDPAVLDEAWTRRLFGVGGGGAPGGGSADG